MRTFTAALLLVCLLPFGATRAAVVDIHVTSSADSGANTLRQAIIDGNALVANNDFPRILIDLEDISPIMLASPLPALTAPYFKIYGTKASHAVIDGREVHQILRTNSSVLVLGLKNVSLVDGYSTTGASACLSMSVPTSMGFATLEDVSFMGCKQSATGITNGAAITTAHNLTIKNSDFWFNESVGTNISSGGAISSFNADLTILGTTFITNSAISNGPVGAARAGGGAIYVTGGKSVTIEDSIFVNNQVYTTNDPGPGIRFGGALEIGLTGALVVRRSAFMGHDAGEGGAIYHTGISSGTRTVELRNVTGIDNHAELGSGGFMASDAGILTLYNNTFWKNSASIAGDNLAGLFGAEIHTAYNNLFAAGIRAGDSCSGFTMSSSAGYNIVPAIECGLGMGSTDKVTTDLHIRGVYRFGTGMDAYVVQLYARSPALDAGHPQAPDDGILARCAETDILGQPRPVDASGTGAPARCDIGALEAQSEPSLFIDDFDGGWWRP